MPTFILAAHETTCTAVSWTLSALAQHANIESQLRVELRAFPLPAAAANNVLLDADTLAELDKMPLLDAVVREGLRVPAPVQKAGRVTTEDTAIRLARPFADRAGALQREIRVRKGDLITIPIGAVHRYEGMWGSDAREWRGAVDGRVEMYCAFVYVLAGRVFARVRFFLQPDFGTRPLSPQSHGYP
jgi:cytochrome P450